MKRARLAEMELRTTSMAPSGEAVAHWDDGGARRAVLVRGAAPGELVRARVDASRRPARGDVIALVEPSAARAPAPCEWASACGGCDWMHLSRAAQREQHLALAAPLGAPARFHAAPRATGYRVRARLHVRHGRVGYYGALSHELVVVGACVVLDPRLDAARAALGELFAGMRGEGDVSLALGAGGVPVAEVRWSGDLAPAAFGRFEAAVAAGRFRGFSVASEGARKPAVIGDPTPWITAADGAPLELAPGGFSQANEDVNRALGARVAELSRGARAIVELYAGAGNFSVLLARVAPLRAVESDEAACEAARRNFRARGAAQAKVTCADAATFEIPRATDLVVLDPPRTGARDACEALAAHKGVRRVVYVSCDRATLARDAALLAPRFLPASVDVFEMFPHTSHVETVVSFERKS